MQCLGLFTLQRILQTVEDVWPTGLAGIWWGSWSTHKLCKMIYKRNGKSENRTT